MIDFTTLIISIILFVGLLVVLMLGTSAYEIWNKYGEMAISKEWIPFKMNQYGYPLIKDRILLPKQYLTRCQDTVIKVKDVKGNIFNVRLEESNGIDVVSSNIKNYNVARYLKCGKKNKATSVNPKRIQYIHVDSLPQNDSYWSTDIIKPRKPNISTMFQWLYNV